MRFVTLATATAGIVSGIGVVIFALRARDISWSKTTLLDELFQERDRLSVTRRQLIVEGLVLMAPLTSYAISELTS